VRLVAELNKASLSGPLLGFATINFLHFAVLLFVVCTVVLVLVSFTAPAPSDAQLAGLTFATTPRGADAEPGRGADVLGSAGVVAAVLAIWWYFS
jgi:solute:Na+ symporter, SSS family